VGQEKQAQEISKTSGLSAREVKSYYHAKRKQSREEKKLIKFKEAMWRDFLYLSAVIIGWLALQGQPWYSEHIEQCW